MEIGLGGCNAHEFQLEMRQVKFLLDYQGAREFEYRLARKNRSATRMNTREGDTLIVPFPIPETTLRQWDESTLDDLPPPPLPFYVPGAPDVSIRPVSWIPGDQPLSVDDLLYLDSEANQGHTRTGFEISPIYSRLRQVDDDDIQPSPPTSPSGSRRKGKQPERDFKSDVLGHAPTQRHKRRSSIAGTEEELPDTRHLRVAQAGVTLWNPFGPSTSTGNLELRPSFAQRPTVVSSDNCLVSRTLAPSTPQDSAAPSDEFVSPLLSHDIDDSLLFSWAPMSPTTSHAPPPGDPRYNPHHSRPTDKIPMAHHEFTPQLDYTLDSPSDTSDSDADTDYGWADSETSSPEGALVTLQDDVPPFPTFDYPDIPLLFNPSSDANIEFPEEPLLETIQPSFKTREPITIHYKRKRLFLTEEDEYGERACKQRRIEL
ncbi:hypothetical protein BC827DRAFT_282977 [Russula dissimulans]|nr:hypothetical protein BC827DRAFT_282977 [Russula dissimulans]